ncbi:MAG: endonuclease V [Planctomycetaceae bacterium]|nr:endonuclease V [Planctomycetaceae bacterium]
MHSLLEHAPDLHAELHQLLLQVPSGRVTTYGKLAGALGDSGAARWVGEALVDHPHDEHCPCHRVVRVDGHIGLYISRDSTEKAARLQTEGVSVTNDRVDCRDGFFDEFQSSAPLARLRQVQTELSPTVRPLKSAPTSVAGVDVSYVSSTEAVAAYVLLEPSSLREIWSTTVVCPVEFPYITGYLSFRELPMFVSLFKQVREADRMADVTFVDGNGILHPRRAGSASYVGIATDSPTIGVGKKLLLGKVDVDRVTAKEPRKITHEGETVGYAMTAGARNRPFFVSPGHLTSLEDARRFTTQVMTDRRLPLPIVLADRLSRDEAQLLKQQNAETDTKSDIPP